LTWWATNQHIDWTDSVASRFLAFSLLRAQMPIEYCFDGHASHIGAREVGPVYGDRIFITVDGHRDLRSETNSTSRFGNTQ
jgi:hypothetical protein